MDVLRKTKDGRTAIFDGATRKFKGWQAAPAQKGSATSFQEIAALKGKPLGQQIWQGLQVPSQMSERGLKGMSSFVPTPEPRGNLAGDIIRGTPKIAADALAETAAKTAPNFISRAALLGMGGAKVIQKGMPFLSRVGSGLASQLESASGAAPGSLEAAAKDATLMGSKGTEEARPLYQAAESELKNTNVWKGRVGPGGTLEMEQGGQNAFKSMPENIRIARRARQMLDSGRELEPAEAHTARKAVDALKGSKAYSKDFLITLRRDLDAIAKSSENIAEADPLHARGVMGKSLRNILPQNKYGGASAFKMGLAPAMAALGGALGGPEGTAAGGAMAAMALSPAAQGVAATGAGLVGRHALAPIAENPKLASLIVAVIKAMRGQDANTAP